MRHLIATLALSLLPFGRAVAQENVDPVGWNSTRALELVGRARLRRELPRGDSTLRSYQAKANGYVYFYLDRREEAGRTLVKVDQIALELYWKRPDLTKQRIVGMRDVSRLPNRMYYHLDHLTVVQNNLGDVIRLGDGDEVRDVPHPAAPGADSIYDYRLADSVTLQLGGGQPAVRVYELQVRPKRVDRSAFVGSVFVDRNAADIVRMTFTFTPASYVDRRLDYINISLDNGLFGGKYWLPNEQSVEIRRQIPELDFAAGAVIKGRMRVSGYSFNEDIPDSIFYGRAVSAAPKNELEHFDFPADIYAGVNEEGLAPPPQMADLRARAAELLGQPRLSGLPAWRLYVPNASSVLRRNSAEGWYAGLGATYNPTPMLRADFTVGYAFRAERPEVTARLARQFDRAQMELRAYYNEPRDIGPVQGMPGALNTLSMSFGGEDYTNHYFTRGASLLLTSRHGWHPGMFARAELHRPATTDFQRLASYDPYVRRGIAGELSLALRREPEERQGVAWDINGRGGLGFFRDQDEGRQNAKTEAFPFANIAANYRRTSADTRSRLELGAHFFGGRSDLGGAFLGLIGGRATLPGYAYRSIRTPFFTLASATYTQTIAYPYFGVRALTAGAVSQERRIIASDQIVYGLRARGSFGAGLSLLWDVVRVDFVKGARWQTLLSVRPDFWAMM